MGCSGQVLQAAQGLLSRPGQLLSRVPAVQSMQQGLRLRGSDGGEEQGTQEGLSTSGCGLLQLRAVQSLAEHG